MSTIFEDAEASIMARDKAFEDLQMAYFCRSHPQVNDCQANRKVLRDELKKFAQETLQPGQFYNFTAENLNLLLSKKPEVLENLALRPSTTPKENTAQSDQKLREQLIKALIEAGVSRQYLEPNENTGLRWVDSHTTQELRQLLANIKSRRKFELMDRNTLKKTVRQEMVQRSPYKPLPETYEFNKSVYRLDGIGLRRLLRDMTADQQREFQRMFGVDAINARLISGQ